MTKLLIALCAVAAFRSVDALRETADDVVFQVESTNQSTEVDALGGPRGGRNPAKPAKPTCEQIYDALVRIPVNPSGCNPSHGGKEFCCDSWMNEFGRELKSANNVDEILSQVKLKMMIWKWIIRPKGNKKKNSHHSAMHFDKQYLETGSHDQAKWEHVGKDSHYFTIVNYCPKKYAIFDTIMPVGRDVSSDFDAKGEIVSTDKIAGPFKFAYSETINGQTKECAFKECVNRACRSDWIDPKTLMAHSAKSYRGAKCFLGIAY